MAISAKAKFLFGDKVKKGSSKDGHDLWTGAANTAGYGVFWLGDRLVMAHKFSMALSLGEDEPSKARHVNTCGVKECVNPNHWIRIEKKPKT